MVKHFSTKSPWKSRVVSWTASKSPCAAMVSSLARSEQIVVHHERDRQRLVTDIVEQHDDLLVTFVTNDDPFTPCIVRDARVRCERLIVRALDDRRSRRAVVAV